MRRLTYRTEYFNQDGTSIRIEEYMADFNTIQEGCIHTEIPAKPMKRLHPKQVESTLTIEQWNYLLTQKPDSQLKYATRYSTENGYAIYSIHEKQINDL